MRLVQQRTETLNAEQTAILMDYVKKAEKRNEEFFKRCRTLRKWYKGEQGIRNSDVKTTVNMVFSHVRSLVPTLFFRDPTFRAIADNPMHEESARAWEGYLNVYIRRTEYDRETKKCIEDAAIYPEAWKKWVIVKTSDEDILTGEGRLSKSRDETDGSFAEAGNSGPTEWQDKQAAIGIRHSPLMVITDSVDRDPEKCRFIAFKYRKLLSELADDPRYKDARKVLKDRMRTNQESHAAKPGMLLGGPAGQDETITLSDKDEEVDIYEVWVYQLVGLKLYKQVVVLLDEYTDKPLRQPMGWEEFSGRYLTTYPVNRLVLTPVPDEAPINEIEIWIPLQKSLNWIVSRIISQIQRNKQYYNFYSTNAVSEQKAKAQFKSAQPVEFIEAREPGNPVIEGVQSHVVSRDDWNLISVAQALIQQISGIGQNRRGGDGVRTATEAGIIEQGIQIRTDEKVDTVSKFIRRDGQILVRILRDITTTDEVFRLTGNVGPVHWGSFTREDAAWSPEIEVDPESFRKAVDNERLQAYIQALTISLQGAPIFGSSVNYTALLKNILDTLGLPNVQEVIAEDMPHELKQLIEIISMLVRGEPIQPQPGENHESELAVIDNFMQSDIFQEFPPEAQRLLAEHRMMTEELLIQTQQMSTSVSAESNPARRFDQGSSTPAGEARAATSGDRLRVGGNA